MTAMILIFDDDEKLIALLTEYLDEAGLRVTHALDGNDAVNVLNRTGPDLVILDIMMPGKDGLTVLQEIRRVSRVPVIMLTARGDDTDRIVGLEMGADDYLPKPFNPRELLARIKAVLRRQDQAAGPKADDMFIRCKNMVLNRAAHILEKDGESIELSTTEFKILEVLMKSPNTALNRDQIMNMAQGREFMAFDRSVDIHISRLRGKIETDPSSPKHIKTVWGTGYMFVDI